MKKLILFFIAFASVGFLQAQDKFSFAFDHMAVSVKDVNRSADFYKNILGLNEITNRSKFEGVRWFAIGEGKELHLISIVKENAIVNKAIHLALTTSSFDQFVAVLDKMKIPYSDWPGSPNKVNIRADGIKQIFFQDPDGNWIEVNSVVAK
ncbi:MAG TPA: VOC family protein [Flavobacterium sp.]|nr:VOC family protein [Flavobacterium sp.]